MLDTFKVSLEQLNTQLNEISRFIDSISLSSISRSTVSYNAVIISLYGCYENYVNSLVEELIRQISDNSGDYTEIPTDMKISNISLSADFLGAKQRYKNFNLNDEEVINNIYSGKITNKLLLKHGGNLSITVLSEYLKSLGIKNIIQSIQNDPKFIKYYSDIKMITPEKAIDYLRKSDTDATFYLLSELISQRNTIAHSWKSDDIIDYAIIKDEWIKFIQVFCECLYNIVVLFYSEWLIKHHKLFCPLKHQVYGSSVVGFFDVIPHWNGNNEAILVKSNDKIHISKILNVKIHENHQASMEIEGHSLKKAKSDNYSFYFDKAFLEAYTSLIDESDISPVAENNETAAPEGTAVCSQI